MTLTRRRVRVSKYIAQVNHMGTDMGTKFMLLYFIYIKQLLNASKWHIPDKHLIILNLLAWHLLCPF